MDVINILYDFLWTIVYLLLFPSKFCGKKEYFTRKFARDIPEREKGGKRIWIHALSVGEVLSTLPLIQAIKKKYPEKPIVLTVKTPQGMKVARKELADEIDDLFFMPLDFKGAVVKITEVVDPYIFILVETDIWPGIISYLKARGVKTILVNGRISPRTFRGYRRFRFYFRQILNDIDLLLMQSEEDSRKMKAIGISSEKIKTVGNIKFDEEWTPMDNVEHDKWVKLLCLGDGHKIFVAGSTHEGEEKPILKVFNKLIDRHPELILIIAPRKLDHIKNIESIGNEMGLKILKRTDLNNNKPHSYNVLILDTIGELNRIYGLASISFVGGSLVPVGGHNLLEPASFSCPVLFGKHTHNFESMSELLLEHNGGIRIDKPDNLFLTLEELLFDPGRTEEIGRNARNVIQANSGAVDRILEIIGGDIASS